MAPDPESGGEAHAATLLRMMRGYWVSQAIFVAARLGLADLLADGPQPCASLAARTGVPARSLYRLLRALASVGVFAEVSDGTFGLTPLAACLQTTAPGSLRASGIVMGEILYPAWGELLHSLQTGRPGFDQVFGTDFFGHLAAQPALGGRFQEMMADLNQLANTAIPAAYDFNPIRRLVDVGGGNGSLLASILQANPTLRGVLFDQPHVLDEARRQLTQAGVADRCELVGGDFFAGLPAGGDAYLLRWVLHDFDDERAARILSACRAAMSSDGRLLIIEQVIPGRDEPASWVSSFLDLQMLVLLGGQERTAAELRDLFAATGFELRRIIPTRSPFSILEGLPSQTGSA